MITGLLLARLPRAEHPSNTATCYSGIVEK